MLYAHQHTERPQNFAWPLRSFFWAWSKLRVVVDSAHRDQFSYAFSRCHLSARQCVQAGSNHTNTLTNRSPGALCHATLKGAEAAPLLAQWLSDSAVQGVQTALHALCTSLSARQTPLPAC
jgi:hypothetical protein